MYRKITMVGILIVSVIFCLTGCISGKIVLPSDHLTNVSVLRYVTAEKEDGEIVWNGTDKDENGNKIPVPTVEEMTNKSMRMDNYMKIQFDIKGKKDTLITAVKFNIVADRDCLLRIVIRDNVNLASEPLYVKTFSLKANIGDGFVVAGLSLTPKSKCLYIGNEPPIDNLKDYDGYKAKWHIKDLQIIRSEQ